LTIAKQDQTAMFFDVSNVGKRETVDEARAAELLAPLLASTEQVRGFRLSNKSYTRGSSAVIAAGLTTVSEEGRFASLVEVDIADVIAGRPEDEALEVLRTLCAPLLRFKGLTSIDVSDNAFGAKGMPPSRLPWPRCSGALL
jgi:Ran GTPase-activating protein (RanGAP) involved in mRNA processing and transport